MPASAEPELLVDTSVAVALVVSDHEQHEAIGEALAHRRLGLAGHAAFETFSVLTRLPPPLRRTPWAVGRLLASNFSDSRFLDADAAGKLLTRLPTLGIAGGAVYDALVGAAALQHQLRLATRDRRAMDTYRALDIDLEVLA
ncbi:MAG: type II toxin-antitoxin system VapC family toxin [Actinomycetota bacterium]|nr:type II toxin-antitoxin system VapC family toxin [Actinomycetota bacterium]